MASVNLLNFLVLLEQKSPEKYFFLLRHISHLASLLEEGEDNLLVLLVENLAVLAIRINIEDCDNVVGSGVLEDKLGVLVDREVNDAIGRHFFEFLHPLQLLLTHLFVLCLLLLLGFPHEGEGAQDKDVL